MSPRRCACALRIAALSAAEHVSRRREEDAAGAASLLTSPNLAASGETSLFTRATADYTPHVRAALAAHSALLHGLAVAPRAARVAAAHPHFPPSPLASG
jgi:hypothetical protein